MNIRQALFTICLLGFAAPAVAPHAQTIGWMDKLFTFRESQKPNPNAGARASRPTYVLQPGYNAADHAQWSEFYSNPNLAAQDYMIGSASKIMRPAGTGMAMAANAGGSAGGFGAVADQALENARMERGSNIQIGEPGEFIADDGSNLGRATKVGEATQDWRGSGKSSMTSRPGDYDYEINANRNGALAAGGETLAETTPKFSVPVVLGPEQATDKLPTKEANGAYLEYNANNQATRYQVQRGDTLGSIAAQPEVYNEAALWPLVYSANRKAIGSNPHRLKPKMALTIPRDYTAAQAKKARQRSGR